MLEAANVLDRLAKDFFEKIVRVIDGYFPGHAIFDLLGIETMERSQGSFGWSTHIAYPKSQTGRWRRLFRTDQST